MPKQAQSLPAGRDSENYFGRFSVLFFEGQISYYPPASGASRGVYHGISEIGQKISFNKKKWKQIETLSIIQLLLLPYIIKKADST